MCHHVLSGVLLFFVYLFQDEVSLCSVAVAVLDLALHPVDSRIQVWGSRSPWFTHLASVQSLSSNRALVGPLLCKTAPLPPALYLFLSPLVRGI